MVADFVGADRALKRLRVTEIDPEFLEHPPTVHARRRPSADARAAIARVRTRRWSRWSTKTACCGGIVRAAHADGDGPVMSHLERVEASVPIGGKLQDAIAKVLLADAGWVPVVDGARFVGVLTPESVFESLRASMRIDDGDATVGN